MNTEDLGICFVMLMVQNYVSAKCSL